MYTDFFINTIKNIWPMLFIFSVIVVSLRFTYLLYNKQKINLYKEFATFCFILYILLLYYIVTFQDNNYGTNNFTAFKEIFRYSITSRLFIKNVIGNILLFIPFGIFTTHYVKNKNIIPTLFLTMLTSCTIEFTQMLIGRTADIDDVILNTIGGIFGFLIYNLGKNIIKKSPGFVKSDAFLNIITILFIIIIVYLLIKIDFWRIIS